MTKTKIKNRQISEAKLIVLLDFINKTCTEPVTSGELFLAQMRDPKLNLSWSSFAQGLRQLAIAGRIKSRPVNQSERELRGDSRGRLALMYWPISLGASATRTSVSVFPGIKITDAVGTSAQFRSGHRPAKRIRVQTGQPAKKAVRPAKAADVQTGNRIERLEKRIVELESVIANLRKILS
jgi:hypothetical protein